MALVIQNLVNNYRPLINRGVVKRALIIALVVGSLLNMINQWDAFWGPAPIQYVKACLTYIVPFLVSSISILITKREQVLASEAKNIK